MDTYKQAIQNRPVDSFNPPGGWGCLSSRLSGAIPDSLSYKGYVLTSFQEVASSLVKHAR